MSTNNHSGKNTTVKAVEGVVDSQKSSMDFSSVEIVRIAGVIKWFDIARGFGFIIPDNGLPDVLLHVRCLRRDGYQTALEGSHIVCEAAKCQKGLQAVHILSMSDSHDVYPKQISELQTRVTVEPETGLERVQVKWFNLSRGYGFASRDNNEDIFIHMETLRRFGLTELRPRQYALVRFGTTSKGLIAVEIYPDNNIGPTVKH